MEDFTIEVDNERYEVKPIEGIEPVLYEIQKNNEFITVLNLTEDLEWEACNDYDEHKTKKLGDAIWMAQ